MAERELALADFAPFEGRPIRVDAANGSLELVLAALQALPGGTRAAGSFRLELHGPLEARLPQGTFDFHLDGEPVAIFIVPLGPDESVMRYEAIFY
jgi:hypothetical protein